MEPKVLAKNSNDVVILEGDKVGHHHKVHNAVCWCGEDLIVSPIGFHDTHCPNDPAVRCMDHGVHGFRFKNLIQGMQTEDWLMVDNRDN